MIKVRIIKSIKNVLKTPSAEKVTDEKPTAVKSPPKSPPLCNKSHIIPRLFLSPLSLRLFISCLKAIK